MAIGKKEKKKTMGKWGWVHLQGVTDRWTLLQDTYRGFDLGNL